MKTYQYRVGFFFFSENKNKMREYRYQYRRKMVYFSPSAQFILFIFPTRNVTDINIIYPLALARKQIKTHVNNSFT